MSKWLVLSMVVVAHVAAPASGPAPRDRDHDRLPDRWEREHHLSTVKPSAGRDVDGDGLSNLRERRLRTHPRRAHTDSDRLRDGAEVRRFHTNPRKRDTDGDGVGDWREVRRVHTNPRRRDTDRDGFKDRCEVRSGTNPRKRRSRPRRRCSDSPQEPPRNPIPAPPPRAFPNRTTTGTPPGWTPRETRSTDITVGRPGTVVEDVRLTNGASIEVHAPGVTVRRVELEGGQIWTHGDACFGPQPLVIEDTTLEPPTGRTYGAGGATIGGNNIVARRVEMWRRGHGWRASDCTLPGRTDQKPIQVEDSFTYMDGGPWPDCPGGEYFGQENWHTDGFQAFHGRGATFVNNTIVFGTLCGTSPWYPGHGSTDPSRSTINLGEYNVDRMLVAGGGYTFRHQARGSVTGLRIVANGWYYGPILNRCSVIGPWEAKIVNIDVDPGPNKTFPGDADYRVTNVVRDQPCNTEEVG